MNITPLQTLVEQRINQRRADWSREHPHLAEVIDRTNLVQSTVSRLRDDPEFDRLIRQANLNEAQLDAAWRLFELAERWIGRVLPT